LGYLFYFPDGDRFSGCSDPSHHNAHPCPE
jgi:hypothetical protein